LSTTVLGLLILGLAPQAQDLFVEFTLKAPIPLLPFLFVSPGLTIFFLAVLIGFWAMPTHYAARMLVDTDERLGDLLAAEGQLRQKKRRHEQLSDEELRTPLCLKWSARNVPRLLGALTFVAVLFAILRSYQNLPTLDPSEGVTAAAEHALIEMAALVVLCAIAFFIYVRNRLDGTDVPILRWILRWLEHLNKKMACFWRAISPGRSHGAEDEASRDVGRFILSLLFIVFIGFFCFGADAAGRWFPRAMAVPFILGGWLPFLSYLSGFGRQWRAPLLIGAYLLSATLALVLGDNHSVRLIDADKTAGRHVNPSLLLQDEVTLWMKENGCYSANRDGTGGSQTPPAPCPRPIIFAAAGGASRAGFFMASIIGYFLQPEEAAKYGLDVEQVRKRIFAISSVSGGSMGAVMVTAALNAAKTDAKALPCIRSSVDQWWGQTVNYWRDCFEALTSGDFLTGGFFGFAFNDMLPFGRWRDRAAVLEDSWRDRYLQVVTDPDKSFALPSCQGLECPFLSLTPQPSHWIPLLVLNGTSEATGSRIITTPLASTYGRDTETTYSKPFRCPTVIVPRSGCQLFVQADRFHDLLTAKVKARHWFGWLGFFERYLLAGAISNDVRLSTAAHNSARFPLISPPGSVRNNKQRIVDRIVDGGYFENYGALSAKELALAIHAIQPDLHPLVVVISNDPNDSLDPNDDATSGQPSPRRPQANSGELVTDITGPLTTFANARTAHGILAVDELASRLHAAISECEKPVMTIQVRVWPDKGKNLSMSWWESSLVQRQLHQQTEDDKVRRQLGKTDGSGAQEQNGPHLEAIWRQMKTTSSCAATG
jgi:hypothetical protein